MGLSVVPMPVPSRAQEGAAVRQACLRGEVSTGEALRGQRARQKQGPWDSAVPSAWAHIMHSFSFIGIIPRGIGTVGLED